MCVLSSACLKYDNKINFILIIGAKTMIIKSFIVEIFKIYFLTITEKPSRVREKKFSSKTETINQLPYKIYVCCFIFKWVLDISCFGFSFYVIHTLKLSEFLAKNRMAHPSKAERLALIS